MVPSLEDRKYDCRVLLVLRLSLGIFVLEVQVRFSCGEKFSFHVSLQKNVHIQYYLLHFFLGVFPTKKRPH